MGQRHTTAEECQPLIASRKPTEDSHDNFNSIGSSSHHRESSTDWISLLDGAAQPPPPTNEISSLDFERVVNDYSIQATKDRYLLDHQGEKIRRRSSIILYTPSLSKPPPRRSTRRVATRWALSAIVGLVTGLTTIVIVAITGNIVTWRIDILDRMAQNEQVPTLLVFGGFCTLNLLLALSASGLCVFVAPEATGSGIPEVKAYLNGVRVKKFTSWPLFGVKIVGTILSVSSSLAVGMEGPLIHIGAIVGASFSKLSSVLSRVLSSTYTVPISVSSTWTQALWTYTTTNLAYFATDAERRDLISIGASVGFAASFGAPIGGLLFILDDIASYFSKSMFLRTLVANAIGTFCLALHSGDLSHYSIIDLGTYRGVKPTEDIFLNRFEIVPLFIVVAVVGGVLGGIFCGIFEFLKVNWVGRLTSKSAKLRQVAVLSLITSALTFGLPVMAWTCKSVEGTSDNTGQGRQFFCAEGQVNEMATIMFGSRGDAIKRILSDPSQFQQRTLWAVGLSFYGLMTLTYGSILPSGIFTPTVLIGASLGGAMGLAFKNVFGPAIDPSVFPVLGVAAMLAGIQRSTVSICVILVEGTGKIQVLLPVIIVVLVARYVAEFFHPHGINETAMNLKKYAYMDHEEMRRYDILQAQDIMSHPPEVIGPILQASELVRILRLSPHNGFPVVEPRSKKFLGLVRRDQIAALIECGVFQESDQPEESSREDASSEGVTRKSKPRPGIAKNPLMHWAYNIKDDRYDHLKNTKAIAPKEDEFDNHEWLRNIRYTLQSAPNDIVRELEDDQELHVPTSADDSMPSVRRFLSPAVDPSVQLQRAAVEEEANQDFGGVESIASPRSLATPRGFAEIGVNSNGNLIVTWLNPECQDLYVNVSAVMNQGIFCVPSHMPVSKARVLFTKLGLRHLVVLGGESGGEVVGLITRANFMPDFILERTGVIVYYSE